MPDKLKLEDAKIMIELLTMQRDSARLELACMIAAEQMILGKQQYLPERVLAARGWSIDWSRFEKPSKDKETTNAQ
jgi:hypothetical protein